MPDRSDELEALTIELLYWARECDDIYAARKMRAAAALLTEAVSSLRDVEQDSETEDAAEGHDVLPFRARCV